MRIRSALRALAVLPSLALVPLAAGQAAAAAPVTSTAGSFDPYAHSHAVFQWGGTNSLTGITLTGYDDGCDGYKIAVRLVTLTNSGAKHYWPWHGYTTGCGTSYTYDTYANDSNGIQYATLDVGVFSGSTLKGLREASPSRRPSA
ncbi:hypothetical protein [Streptomyces sp. NBC_00388]|uniref:hypothetical protein n=1 Tax=Streptomyces sp. NBC_00388 TaxID=2975735 RepID=UPI002E22FE70